jgi:hypothetical protein
MTFTEMKDKEPHVTCILRTVTIVSFVADMPRQLHRRKSSRDEDENIVLVAQPIQDDDPDTRSGLTQPFRSPFTVPFPSHSRTRSISTTPSSTSPPLYSFPDASSNHPRKHTRMHSRNLSLFFPRPGSTTISERFDEEAPVSSIPSANPTISLPGARPTRHSHNGQPLTPIGVGFTFGGRPPGDGQLNTRSTSLTSSSSVPGTASRRGHHHKHSMSHNFFSFLEPGGHLNRTKAEEELHTQPTPVPVSPWTPMSGFPSSTPQNGTANDDHPHPSSPTHPSPLSPTKTPDPTPSLPLSILTSSLQFVLGAWLWVSGQQIGSLSVTALGYWVVFDAFGLGVAWILPAWVASGGKRIRRPYG